MFGNGFEISNIILLLIMNAFYEEKFANFKKSKDTLNIYFNYMLIYSSSEKMLYPLIRYVKYYNNEGGKIVVMDKIIGKAAALLLVLMNCECVFSPVASKLAVDVLTKNGIPYVFDMVVPYIKRVGSNEMCPMEKMASNMNSPDKFYALLKDLV